MDTFGNGSCAFHLPTTDECEVCHACVSNMPMLAMHVTIEFRGNTKDRPMYSSNNLQVDVKYTQNVSVFQRWKIVLFSCIY